jgi:hypothetical protein
MSKFKRAAVIAVLAGVVAIPATAAEARSLRQTYTDVRVALVKAHGVKAAGRNIRRYGVRVSRAATRPAHRSDYRQSIAVMRRALHPGSYLLTPTGPYMAPAGTATLRATGAPLASIARCESGGNYATNTGNGFYGAYQFTQQTWESVGGTGNPAAASPAEQDRRAAMLYARSGSRPWPVCGS